MSNLYRFVGLAAALLISLAGHAEGNANAEGIEVSGAWTRATAPGQEQAGVDLSITSKQAAALVGVSSPAAGSAELHSMTDEDGMMRMREVKSIELPAGKRVDLGASGYHLMLNELKAPLKEGDSVPLVLSIKVGAQQAVVIKTVAKVKSLHATSDEQHGDMHMQMKMQ
jgi:periplasmic copper chaperone A